MKTISRKDAKASGLKRYFTGKACKHGHVDERRIHDGACCECQRITYRKYMAENPEKEAKRKQEYMVDYYRSVDPDIRKVKAQEHYVKYAEGYKIRALTRMSRCEKATPSWVSKETLREIYANCPDGYEVDHIIPLMGVLPDGNRICGLHVPWNLQYLTEQENAIKRNKVQQHDLNGFVRTL